MSVPVSRDPQLVVTLDGARWVRAAVTRSGRGLYVLEGTTTSCPEFVMASLGELAELGVKPVTDLADAVALLGALPMPVGPEPQPDDRLRAPWGRSEDGRPLLPMGAHWTDIPELVDQYLAGIQARVDEAQPGTWFVSPTCAVPDTVCTQYAGYTRTVGRLTNMLAEDLELVLHAHGDLTWCLDLIARLRARVVELEKAAVAALAPHEKFPDSPHCSADGGLWPCHTVYVLEPVVAPKSDLRPGTEAARRMIQDRQDIDTGLVCIRCGEELDEENVSDFCSETCAASPAPGELAEQRHLLYDADPDSTVPPLVDIHRHQTTRRGTR